MGHQGIYYVGVSEGSADPDAVGWEDGQAELDVEGDSGSVGALSAGGVRLGRAEVGGDDLREWDGGGCVGGEAGAADAGGCGEDGGGGDGGGCGGGGDGLVDAEGLAVVVRHWERICVVWCWGKIWLLMSTWIPYGAKSHCIICAKMCLVDIDYRRNIRPWTIIVYIHHKGALYRIEYWATNPRYGTIKLE